MSGQAVISQGEHMTFRINSIAVETIGLQNRPVIVEQQQKHKTSFVLDACAKLIIFRVQPLSILAQFLDLRRDDDLLFELDDVRYIVKFIRQNDDEYVYYSG